MCSMRYLELCTGVIAGSGCWWGCRDLCGDGAGTGSSAGTCTSAMGTEGHGVWVGGRSSVSWTAAGSAIGDNLQP